MHQGGERSLQLSPSYSYKQLLHVCLPFTKYMFGKYDIVAVCWSARLCVGDHICATVLLYTYVANWARCNTLSATCVLLRSLECQSVHQHSVQVCC